MKIIAIFADGQGEVSHQPSAPSFQLWGKARRDMHGRKLRDYCSSSNCAERATAGFSLPALYAADSRQLWGRAGALAAIIEWGKPRELLKRCAETRAMRARHLRGAKIAVFESEDSPFLWRDYRGNSQRSFKRARARPRRFCFFWTRKWTQGLLREKTLSPYTAPIRLMELTPQLLLLYPKPTMLSILM